MAIDITWKVEGSDVLHTIPEKAIVCVEGENGKVYVYVDEDDKVVVDISDME